MRYNLRIGEQELSHTNLEAKMGNRIIVPINMLSCNNPLSFMLKHYVGDSEKRFQEFIDMCYEMTEIPRGTQKEMLVALVEKQAIEIGKDMTFDEFKEFVSAMYRALETGIFDYEKPTRK